MVIFWDLLSLTSISIIFVLFLTLGLQVAGLNEGLRRFDALYIVPVFQVKKKQKKKIFCNYNNKYIPLGSCFLSLIFFLWPISMLVCVYFQAHWILFGVLGGVVFFKEFSTKTKDDISFFTFGVLLCITGVLALSRRKVSNY